MDEGDIARDIPPPTGKDSDSVEIRRRLEDEAKREPWHKFASELLAVAEAFDRLRTSHARFEQRARDLMAGFGTRVVRHLIEQKRRAALQTALDQESGPEEDYVEIDLRIEDCPVGPHPRHDDAHLDVCFAWLAALHAFLIDAGTLGAGVSLVDTTEARRSFAEAIANGKAFGVTWSPLYEFAKLKEHIRAGELSPERARHQLSRVHADLRNYEIHLTETEDRSIYDAAGQQSVSQPQVDAAISERLDDPGQERVEERRPAAWFRSATAEGLYADLLRVAVNDGRLKRSVKQGGRWQHSISEVCERYPGYKSDILRSHETEGNRS